MVYVHSVKVPTQYKKTAGVLRAASDNKKSLKTLIYEEKHAKLGGMEKVLRLYVDNRFAINHAIESSKILQENPRLSPDLCKVLVTELIYGRKLLKGESKPVCTVRDYHQKLLNILSNESHLTTRKVERAPKPRYVRVNTNKMSVDDALKALSNDWSKKEIKHSVEESYENYLKAVRELDQNEFISDMHLDDVFVFHPSTRNYWACHQLVKEKKFMLQDKGTCLVAELLQPPPGSTVLDMCAAPGMKTIHLSNKMKNTGVIYAIEQSADRYKTLCSMLSSANVKIAKPINADVLTIDSNMCPSVEYILLDPSCSGSGMQNRLSLNTEDKDPKRLYQLAGLQIKMLFHAMEDFPDVKRIVYCTCSLYAEENEQVIQRGLQKFPQFKLLSAKKALRKNWINVGSSEYKNIGKKCIYAVPEEDLSDGIFIAILEKTTGVSDK